MMNKYDKRLIERLRNWEKVYPEDEDTPEGNLYLEAAERIVELSDELEKLRRGMLCSRNSISI